MHRITNVNETELTGTCSECGPVTLRKTSAMRGNCHNIWYQCYPNYLAKLAVRRNKYRTINKKDCLGPICEICSRNAQLCFDHDHTKYNTRNLKPHILRGTLCRDCNIGIGMFKDNPQLLLAAVDYIKSRS